MATRLLALFDSDCAACSRGAALVRRLGRDGAVDLRLLPSDAAGLAAVDPRLDLGACRERLHVVLPDGRIEAGYDALVELGRELRGLRPAAALGGAEAIRPLGRRVYDLFARNRHRVGRPRCAVPGRS